MSDDDIPLAGVIGNPVGHSLSPRLHGYWLNKYGLRGHYVPIKLTQETFEAGLRALPLLGFKGVNVTIPFKEMALTLADIISDRAALIGAANTITFRGDGQIHADNTDGFGFIENIRQTAPDWRASDGPAMVLGSGGASRAILSSLLEAGAPEIILANRTRARADMLAEHFGARVRVLSWTLIASELGAAHTLVNTTSLGMTGQAPLVLDLKRLSPKTLVTDVVYTPLETELLKAAAAKGCQTVDGIGMLLHQAVPGFESWFKLRPEVGKGLRRTVLAYD